MANIIGVIAQTQIQQLGTDVFSGDASNKLLNQPYILDTINLKRVFLQSIPGEINVTGDSQFATIGTMGRNLPYYHYTGAEEIVSFTISWFGQKEDFTDVIQKCKWFKSLTVNDGDVYGVHPVVFSFGGLFKESKFIVTAAPYKLQHFIRDKNMLPCLAASEITLKKISSRNETHADIFKVGT